MLTAAQREHGDVSFTSETYDEFPRDEVGWIRRRTTWELSNKKASFTGAETERE